MLQLDKPIDAELQKFFRWWAKELAFLVPGPIRKLLGGRSEFLELVRTSEGLDVTYRNREIERKLGTFDLNGAGGRAREQLLETMPELAEARIALRLAQGQALRKTIKLPAAAEENLKQVLAFEMDRLTPFKSDQVYFDARVVARTPATRQIKADLLLAPRDKLDALLDDLAACGWQPEIVDMADPELPGAHNLLPEKYRPLRSPWPRRMNLALGAVVVLLAAALACLPFLHANSEVASLQEQVRKTGKTAKEVEALREEADKLLHQARFLQDKKRTNPVLVDVLEELTRLIPNNTWLNGLQYKDRRFVIQGQSPSASSLIELIEGSPYFRNTSFVSPVTKDAASNLERFQIASDVANGRFSEDSKPEAAVSEPPAAHR